MRLAAAVRFNSLFLGLSGLVATAMMWLWGLPLLAPSLWTVVLVAPACWYYISARLDETGTAPRLAGLLSPLGFGISLFSALSPAPSNPRDVLFGALLVMGSAAAGVLVACMPARSS